MTNPDNVGGLPELPAPDFVLRWDSMRAAYYVSRPNVGNTDVYTADQMRAYGELCRAAPAGGDVSSTWEYGCDAPRNGGAPYIGATIGGHFVRFRIEDDFADAVKRHTFLRTLQSHLNAAPAGGDVAVGEIGELNGTKLIVGRDEDALARLPKGTKLYTRPQDSAPAGVDGAVAWLCEWTDEDDGETVRVSFEFKRGAENRALEVGGDARVIPLYTHQQHASGDAELIEAVGTYEEAVRLFGRTSPSASRAYCRMTDVLAAMQAKEAK